MPLSLSKKLLLVTLGLAIFLVFFRFFTLISFPDSHTILKKGETIKIFPDQTFTQTFMANRDNLDALQFLLRTPGPGDNDTVQVTVADETCTTPLRESTMKVSYLNADNLYIASFAPIKDSHEKKFCAILSFSQTDPKTKYLRFFTTDTTDESKVLTLPQSEATKNQSLSLRLVYNNDTAWQDLRELNQRISQYKPWFLKGIFLTTIATTFVVLSVTLIALLVTKRSDSNLS